MDKNKNNDDFSNVESGKKSYEDYQDSESLLNSHNDKRKAQDSSDNDLKNSRD